MRPARILKESAALAATALTISMTPPVPPYPSAYSRQRCGNTNSSRLLLTFDDWNVKDPYIATRTGAYLKSRNIRAAFFLINKYAKNYPDIVSTLRAQGHYVGNHTYSHPSNPGSLTNLTNSAVRFQIADGVKTNVLRPPHGEWNSRVRRIASQLGYRLCTWTIRTDDWQKPDGVHYRSIDSIVSEYKKASADAKHAGTIYGHLYTNYPAALPKLIDAAHAEGRLFCRNRGPVGAIWPRVLKCT
ncbi:polysaccharide deacetylase family protein [Streptomyces sp. NPDC002577]